MDLSSVLPVLIAADLIISHIDNSFSNTITVLDLCCSPGNYHNWIENVYSWFAYYITLLMLIGAKYQLLIDTISRICKNGSKSKCINSSLVIGTDNSQDRLNTCKSLITKWY